MASDKKHSYTTGALFGIFAAISMAVVVGTSHQVASVDFTQLMLFYNLTTSLCLLVWDFILWADHKRVPLKTLGTW